MAENGTLALRQVLSQYKTAQTDIKTGISSVLAAPSVGACEAHEPQQTLLLAMASGQLLELEYRTLQISQKVKEAEAPPPTDTGPAIQAPVADGVVRFELSKKTIASAAGVVVAAMVGAGGVGAGGKEIIAGVAEMVLKAMGN